MKSHSRVVISVGTENRFLKSCALDAELNTCSLVQLYSRFGQNGYEIKISFPTTAIRNFLLENRNGLIYSL